MPQEKPDPADIFEQIRTNWAFEHLIVSVLAGAGVGAALTFVIGSGGAVFGNAAFWPSIAAAFGKGVIVGFLIFLVGFLSGVLVVAPLFKALERAKRRGMWPYIAAALTIAGAALALVSSIRGPAAVGVGIAAPVFAASVVIAMLFTRRVRPLWRAAEKAEMEEAEDVKKLN